MLNDEWTLQDQLGHKKIVKKIIQTLPNLNPPFTLGLYGGWGSGKTSIMRDVYFHIGGKKRTHLFKYNSDTHDESLTDENNNIYNKIKPKTGYEAVWFNPWMHEFEQNPVLGLLHEIRHKFDLYTKSTAEVKKITSVTLRSGLDMMSSAIKTFTKLDISASNIEKHGNKYEEKNFSTRSETQNFKIVFEAAIEMILGNKDKKLVVFIDDLDRCSNESILALLEGIKLYLSSSNCIFIFGLDQANVIRALNHNSINRDYLDKLFQSILRIPVSKKFRSDFLPNLIEKLLPTSIGGEEEKHEYIKMLVDILEPNPRKIKNFLNSLVFYWDIKDKKDLDISIFTLFHYLRIYYEGIFELLEKDPTLFPHLYNICKGELPNIRTEFFFAKSLYNPLSKDLVFLEDQKDAHEKKIAELDMQTFNEMKSTFFSLENFKKHFSEKCADLSKISLISSYLGILK